MTIASLVLACSALGCGENASPEPSDSSQDVELISAADVLRALAVDLPDATVQAGRDARADGAIEAGRTKLGITIVTGPPVATSLPPSGAAGGKLTGTYPNPGVNLASSDLPTITLTGDTTGSGDGGTIPTVTGKLNGATAPAAGALTTGNVLQVNGSSSLTYGGITNANLTAGTFTGITGTGTLTAGGTGTGFSVDFGTSTIPSVLPLAKLTGGTAAQVLVENAGATAPAWVTLSGKVTTTAAGVTSVSLATTDLPFGTNGQFLVTNAGATAASYVSLSNDVTCTAAGVCTVGKVSGASPMAVSAALTEFGTNPATNGAIGLPNGAANGINFRNGANSVNVTGFSLDSSNEISLGDGNVVLFIMSAGSNQFRFDNAGNIKDLVGNADPGVGGGAGVLAFHNSTTIPTAIPTAGYIFSGDTVGVHLDTASTSFNDYMIAPVQQGSINTQANKSRVYSGVARTTTNSAVTVLTIPVATSTTSALLDVDCIGRDQASGTVGDFFAYKNIAAFTNVAGTVTGANTAGTAITTSKTSMAAATITFLVSGTNVLVQATGLSSVTVDWTCEARAIVD